MSKIFGIFLEGKYVMKRILVFSPSFRIRAMLVGMLTCDKVEVESVTSRQALFRRCAERQFESVIIEDYRLFMDGQDAIRRIRADFAAYPRIIVLSSLLDHHTVVTLLECGVDEYLLLPISPARLRQKVCDI